MPLTLECYEPGNEGIAGCTLTGLWWEGNYEYISKLGMETGTVLELHGSGGAIAGYGGSGSGSFSVELDLSVVADWDNLFVRFGVGTTLSQLAAPGKCAIFSASWWIRAVFECGVEGSPTPQEYTVLLYERDDVEDHCWVTVDVVDRAFAYGSGGGAYAIQYSSAPLADCTGITIDMGPFDTLPEGSIDYGSSTSGSMCLYASGGTPPYLYKMVSPLPANLELDQTTGCLSGRLVDRGSSRTLTFQVSDANRDIAEVSCNFMMMCGGIRKTMNRAH